MEYFIADNNLGYDSLTNFDLYNHVERLKIPNFRGVYMRDTLPKKTWKNECGIMNFNTSNQTGSHWVAWFKEGSTRIYFDSFGCICPMELQKYLKTATEFRNNTPCIQRNSEQIQEPNTQICGQLCLYVLKNLLQGKQFQNIINTI